MPMRRLAAWILSIALLTLSFPGCSGEKKDNSSPDPQITGEPAQGEEDPSGTVGSMDTKYKKLIFTDNINKEVKVPYSPVSFEKGIKPYTVKRDLSNIANLGQFGNFTDEQKELLSKNAFVVSPTKEKQLFYIYEKNAYLKLPSFITTDSVLQVYHVFYDYSLRHLESDSLIKIMEELTNSMLDKSLYLYESIENPVVKAAAARNAEYFAVAQMALKGKIPSDIPPVIKTTAEKEYALIEEAGGFKKSSIFPFTIDYSQFKPRGHYSKTDDYERYFKAMMWYGQAPFPLYKDKEQKERNIDQTLQALLLTYSVFLDKKGTHDIELWEKIYEPTAFYVGKSDDLTLYDYKALLMSIYSENVDVEELNDSAKLDAFYKEADKLPVPKIVGKYTEVDVPVGKQFRFLGKRYLPDSEILQELVEPGERTIPSGLDVLGVLGSERAYEIQKSKLENRWEGYASAFEKLRDTFLRIPDVTWRSNMYYGWLWALSSLTRVPGAGYPSFMTNSAWVDKSLNTALGSWSELRHDTILYGKEIGAEAGGAEMPKVLGYIEPSVEVYNKLMWLTRYSRENLDKRGILPEELKNYMTSFEDMLEFLTYCSIKELNNEELTDQEYWQIFTYGGRLESLTSQLASDGGKWNEILSESDKNMAVIADFSTVAPAGSSKGGYVEAAVGPANEIYVVVPIGGKLYLTRGAVFSYYEFTNESGRLSDEEWQKMLDENKNPSQPSWTESFIKGGKGQIPAPEEPYNAPNITREP